MGLWITQLLHWNSTTVELELKPFLDISAFENYSVDKLGSCCSILWILCHCEKLRVAVEARNASLQNKIWPSSWTKEQHWPTSRLRQIREKFLKFNFDNLILWESWLLVFKTKSGLSQIKNQQPKSDGRGDYSDISVKERKATHLNL